MIDNIHVINTKGNPLVTLNAPGGSVTLTFKIDQVVSPSLVAITNDYCNVTCDPGNGPILLINGTVTNPIGETDVTNVYGPISSSGDLGVASSYDTSATCAQNANAAGTTNACPHYDLIQTNVLALTAGTDIGAAQSQLNLDLINWLDHPQQITATAGGSMYLDLLGLVRDSSPPTTPHALPIGDLTAGDSILLRLQTTVYETGTGAGAGIDVQSTSGPSSPPPYLVFYHPDATSPQALEQGAFAGTAQYIASTYDFSLLDAGGAAAGGSITVDAADAARTVDTAGAGLTDAQTAYPANERINVAGTTDIEQTGKRQHAHQRVRHLGRERPDLQRRHRESRRPAGRRDQVVLRHGRADGTALDRRRPGRLGNPAVPWSPAVVADP
ncbi:MAG: hypothetical protein ACRDOK_11125 [Streptosporangiaceae bacterium]